MKENISIFDFELSDEEMSRIAALNRNEKHDWYYHAGTTTITDFLKAQTLFRKSNEQVVDAYGDFRVKTVEYLLATGR